MNRPYGMSQHMFTAYVTAMFQAGINPEHTQQGGKRVVQTIGTAPASAGTHGKDGLDIFGHAYSCAVDISVTHDLSDAQIDKLLQCLWSNGYCAWHRQAPEFPGNEHIHAVYAGERMKHSLRNQVHSFLKHRSGLVSDRADKFVQSHLTDEQENLIRTLFLQFNPAEG